MNEANFLPLYILGSLLLFGFALSLIILAAVYKQRQIRQKTEALKQQLQHQEELFSTRMEVQEESMSLISEELHDNVGQMLSLCLLHINLLSPYVTHENGTELITKAKKNLSDALADLRNISHSLNGERITKLGLVKAVEHELQNLEKIPGIKCSFYLEGIIVGFNNEQVLLAFRILQEAIQNVVKHAKATRLDVKLLFEPGFVKIEIRDNGIGFDLKAAEQKGSLGIRNIHNRLRLLNAQSSFVSKPGEGTCLSFSVPVKG